MIAQLLRKAVQCVLHSKLVGILLFFSVLAGVGLFAAGSISSMDRGQLKGIGIADFLPPLGLILLAYMNRFLFWIRLTGSFDLRAPFIKAGRAFFYSLLGRYVPGKAGLFLLRLRAYEGKSKRKVGAALVTEYISTILAASLLVLLGSLLADRGTAFLTRWIPVAVAAAALLVLRPRLLRRLVNGLIGITGRNHLVEFPTKATTVAVTSGYILTGLLHGMALFLILNKFEDVSLNLYPVVTGSYYTAGLIGIFAFFAPGGLGVREGVLFLLLPVYICSSAVVASAAVMRLLTLLAELLLASLFHIAFRLHGREKSPAPASGS